MKYTKVVAISLPLLFTPISALQADAFDELDQEIAAYENNNAAQTATDFTKFTTQYLSEFDQWRSGYLKDFDIKQQKTIEKWGSAEVSENTKNIEYSSDSTLKSIIDYENNEVTIEVLVDQSLTKEEAALVLIDKVTKASLETSSNLGDVQLNKKGINVQNLTIDKISYSDTEEQKSKKIIKQQTNTYLQDVEKEADKLVLENTTIPVEIVEKIIEEKKQKIKKEETVRLNNIEKEFTKLRVKSVKNNDTQFKVVKYKVKLPQYGLAKRAKLYIPYAEKESRRFDIPVALVMAIMHSESAFDYKAKSAIPAYGLMQIVPRSAGHDVNKLVRHLDKPMTSEELYVPPINVETGVAYLNILDKRYLKGIENPQSRLYCTIAAYNTGAGNVAKVFNKKGEGNTRNINKAAKIINTLTPDEVYEQLIKKLPYDETKHYLKKVSNRMSLYEAKA